MIVLFATVGPSNYASTHNMRAFLISVPAAENSQFLSWKVIPVLCLQNDDVFTCMMCVYIGSLVLCSENAVLSSVLYSSVHT
jgi:hypothetical protein